MSGARVVPIKYTSSKESLDELLSQINGVFFPGGSVEFKKGDT